MVIRRRPEIRSQPVPGTQLRQRERPIELLLLWQLRDLSRIKRLPENGLTVKSRGSAKVLATQMASSFKSWRPFGF